MSRLPLWIVFIIICFEALVIALLIPGDVTDDAIKVESSAVFKAYGADTYYQIYERANGYWNSHLIESGVLEAIEDHLLPTREEMAKPTAFDAFGTPWFVWVKERIDALSDAYFFVMFRFSQLQLWMPYFLVLLLPSLLDGFCTWRIRRTNFAFISPLLHQLSTVGTLLLTVVIFGLFMAPIVLPVILIPSAICLACLMIGILIGNTQKRI